MIKRTARYLKPSICRDNAGIFSTSIRTSFYNHYKHGPTSISDPQPNYWEWFKSFFGREGLEFLQNEARRIFLDKPFRTTIPKEYELNKTYIFEHFDSDASIQGWKPVADSDTMNGFSTSTIVRSPSGHALFKGILDNRIPDDGVTMNSGFAGIIGPRRERDSLFETENFWDWSDFNTVEVKFRGDGRKYWIVMNTGSLSDDRTYFDTYSFPLYTRGGPYWQIYQIPFSKFFLSSKGMVQDQQGMMPSFNVRFIAVTLQDKVDGPFALELDYIGLRIHSRSFSEITAYESYSFPHIRFRPLQVDCAPPDANPS